MYNENEMDPDMLQNYEDFIIAMYQHVKNKVVMYDNEQQIESIIAKFTKGAQKEFKRINNEITAMQKIQIRSAVMRVIKRYGTSPPQNVGHFIRALMFLHFYPALY